MVIAIGVDIVKISRISRVLRRHGDRFLHRILHQSELAIYTSLPPAKRDQFVAGAWAAKEAVFKTLDPADQANFTFRNWYRHSIGNRPAIAYKPVPPALPISPPETTLSQEDFLLSISHDNDMLVATVLRQRSLKIDHCDILIVDTGLVDSILAVALSWQGMEVLHIDANSYYGDSSSIMTIDQLKKWCVEVNSGKVQHFSDVQIYVPRGKATNGFSIKGYGVDLNPRVMFTQSDLLALLLQSRVYKYLEFQNLSNFHVFENDNFKSKLSNTIKEEIFTDQNMSLTTKRSLMKFLKFISQDNNYPDKKSLLLENTKTPIVDFLANCFKLHP